MEKCFSEVVDVLAEDEVLLKSSLKFWHKLGFSIARKEQIMHSYRQGVTTNYEMTRTILQKWMQLKGSSATVAELRRKLIDNDFRFCSDKLSKYDELTPSIGNTDDMDTSDTSPDHGDTEIPPFGFQEVVVNFTGRVQELATLNQYFNSGKYPIVVLSGLSGVGKTQLATKFALSVSTFRGSPVIKTWLAGENAQSLHHSIDEQSQYLNLESIADMQLFTADQMLKNTFENLQRKKTVERWLIVIDNVNEMYDEFKRVVRTLLDFGTPIFLLITSRQSNILPGEHLPLQVFDTPSSLAFFKTSLKINNNSSDQIITELSLQLGNFPLALRQAAAYILQQKAIKGQEYIIRNYLDQLCQVDTTGLNEDTDLAECHLATTKVLKITLDNLKTSCGENGDVAAEVILVIAFMNPNLISKSKIFKLYNRFNSYELTFIRILNASKLLVKYSLLNESYGFLNIHRFIQQTVRKQIAMNGKEAQMFSQFWASFNKKEWEEGELNQFPVIAKSYSQYRSSFSNSISNCRLNNSWLKYYTLVEFLGSGSYGGVYKSVDCINKTSSAVKITYLQNTFQDTEATENDYAMRCRMQREFNLVAGKQHSNIVNVFDGLETKLHETNIILLLGEVNNSTDRNAKRSFSNLEHWAGEAGLNAFFIHMELCGKSLRQWINDSGEQSEDLIVPQKTIIMNILEGIRFLHLNKILHRDLKSENVFFPIEENSYCVKIGDFGLSRIIHSNDSRTSMQTNAPTTTPNYKAPELDLLNDYTLQADLYSLGLLIYEIIKMLKSDDRRVEFIRIRTRQSNMDLPNKPFENAGDVILQLTETDPNKRLKTVGDINLKVNL